MILCTLIASPALTPPDVIQFYKSDRYLDNGMKRRHPVRDNS